MTFAGGTAIAGIGQTAFTKDSGRTEFALALEAIAKALDDAGLEPRDVDGFSTFTMDSSEEIELARALGCGEITFFSRVHYGGGAACAVVHQAAMAVATGAAHVVVCYRALNGRSWRRFGGGVHRRLTAQPTQDEIHYSWYAPFGLVTPASWVAMFARRAMFELGWTSEDFGRVAVADRKHAATNPDAFFYGKPITLDDHASSRMIVDPLRLLDCCQESDGGAAVVVTSLERARSLRRPPAVIAAAAQGSGDEQEGMTSYARADLTGLPEMNLVARQMWAQSGLGPDDIQTAVLYDHFTPFVLTQLAELGFCRPGEAPDFVREGGIEIGGRLPVNTNGGQLGEAYIHGMNGLNEAVRQVRGTAVNQVEGAHNVVVTAGTGVPTSGLILQKDG